MPANTGVTWPDARHLTLSFVPDGTRVGAASSVLNQSLNAIAPSATWQKEIVRAFQVWAARANVNVGVVPDGGQALGTAGEVQGDNRFGDIRIAAVPLPTDTIITNTNFQWSGSTWSGDVLINSAQLYSIGQRANRYDVFTAMLNEAGNVLGVIDTATDTTSGVYYRYNGVKSDINMADTADVRALYGNRTGDAFDAAASNGTSANATNLGSSLTLQPVEADVTTIADVDHYKFTVPLTAPLLASLSVKVTTTGLSTLQGSLQVYNAAGQLVGSATTTNPLGGDLTVTLNQITLGGTYSVRVAGNGNAVAGIGGYKLSLSNRLLDGTVQPVVQTVQYLSTELGADDLIATATNVLPPVTQKPDARFNYVGRATIITANDVDFYKVTAPTGVANQKLNVLAWAMETNGLVPKVEVFNAQSQPVAYKLLGNEGGTFAIEVAQVTAGATYYVKVSALNPGGTRVTGNYVVGINFCTEPATALTTFASGTLQQATSRRTVPLTVTQNRLHGFVLSTSGAAWQQVRMEILDASGTVVTTLSAYSGVPAASGYIYLRSGSYTARFTSAAPSGTAFAPATYTLLGRVASDPIGPRSTDSSPQQDTWGGSSDGSASGTSYDRPYYF